MVVVLMVVMVHGQAQGLTMGELREYLLTREVIEGRFVQCSLHGEARIKRVGDYMFEPGRRLVLDFDAPHGYRISFERDGTYRKSVGGMEQKTARHSAMGRLLFAVVNMQEGVLQSRFEMEVRGSLEGFEVVLTPLKRMAKVLQLVEVVGVSGLVTEVRMVARDGRVVSVRLGGEEVAEVRCE